MYAIQCPNSILNTAYSKAVKSFVKSHFLRTSFTFCTYTKSAIIQVYDSNKEMKSTLQCFERKLAIARVTRQQRMNNRKQALKFKFSFYQLKDV